MLDLDATCNECHKRIWVHEVSPSRVMCPTGIDSPSFGGAYIQAVRAVLGQPVSKMAANRERKDRANNFGLES